ncbi:MAG: LysM peptidoglycan-binding domain-containing protein [Flavobacteriales bacterium]|nr:LysM peptidoglycan-binding domain-containing protein [Flavobacteriales bacterium]MCX7768305.1 LysM peptidoglycan-binding domain-containing protein [Flavobacteriales bacterium]MDW8409933.1 LysM peptidoglycan-binding domain-containing protein [Flavobacteriales bacterium]
MASASVVSVPVPGKKQRPIEIHNGLKSVIVRPGDTQESLAQEFDMAVWQIRRFNELGHGEPLSPGTRLYLEPRHDAHPQIKSVVLSRSETWKSLSAAYGVRSASLKAMNPGLEEPLPEGVVVKLSSE